MGLGPRVRMGLDRGRLSRLRGPPRYCRAPASRPRTRSWSRMRRLDSLRRCRGGEMVGRPGDSGGRGRIAPPAAATTAKRYDDGWSRECCCPSAARRSRTERSLHHRHLNLPGAHRSHRGYGCAGRRRRNLSQRRARLQLGTDSSSRRIAVRPVRARRVGVGRLNDLLAVGSPRAPGRLQARAGI